MTAQILFLMPASEILAEILTNCSKDFLPSFFHPFVFGAYGVLGTLAVFWVKTCELTAPEIRGKWYPSDVYYLLLVFFMILSAVFSTNPGSYSSGYLLNYETPLSFLGYFALFFSGSRIRSNEYRKKLVIVLLLVEAVHGVFAFLQTFNIQIAFSLLMWHSGAAYGLTPNSNYYGGLSVFMLACASGAFLFSDRFKANKIIKILLAVFSGFIFYTMMGSRARLVWFGFAAMMLFYLVSGLVMIKGNIERTALKRYFAGFLALCGVFAAVFAVTHLLTDYVSEEVQRTQMEVEGKLDNGLGSDRLLLWQCGLESLKRHWVTGIGLDNYRQVFYEKYGNVEMPFFRDKAHNEFVHTLVTQGVFAFAAYMYIYFHTIVINVKKIFKGDDETSRSLDWIFLAMLVTYLAQAFFNTSVISVAPHFWLVLGLLNVCDRPLEPYIRSKNNS